MIWAASSKFGTNCKCEQRRFRRACTSVQSCHNRRCSLIQAMSQEEPSNRKPDPWPLWLAVHAQLKFVMTECSKTQIHLTCHKWSDHFCSDSLPTTDPSRAVVSYWQKGYRKFPKYSNTQNICCNQSKIWTKCLYHREMSPNDADGMANSVDPDQTAPLGSVWSGSALFAQAYLTENLGSLQ